MLQQNPKLCFIVNLFLPSVNNTVTVVSLSHVQLFFATAWNVAHQAPLSIGFPRKNTVMRCHFLLQGIFPAQELNLCLFNYQVNSLPESPEKSYRNRASLMAKMIKNPPATDKTWVRSLGPWLGISPREGNVQTMNLILWKIML